MNRDPFFRGVAGLDNIKAMGCTGAGVGTLCSRMTSPEADRIPVLSSVLDYGGH